MGDRVSMTGPDDGSWAIAAAATRSPYSPSPVLTSAMTHSPDPISLQALRDRPILDLDSTESLGRLDALWVDPKARCVVGLVCKSGLLGQKRRAFAWSQVQAIGHDGIFVAVPSDAEFVQPEGAYDLHGHEVWTDGGDRIGVLKDLAFFGESGQLDRYGLCGNGWNELEDGRAYLLPATAAVSGGPKRLVVREDLARTAIADDRPDDRPDLPLPDWDTLRSNAETTAKQWRDRVQDRAENLAENLTDLAKDRLGDHAETLAERARQAQKGARNLARQARHRAETLAEQARDRVEGTLGDREETPFNPAAVEALPPAKSTIDVAARPADAADIGNTAAPPTAPESNDGHDPWETDGDRPPAAR